MMVVLSPPANCGCRLTFDVLMSLRSMPEPTKASMTACWRSLVWFIAPLTSGATNSIDALTVSLSGVPCTSPAPTTVTWRVSLSGAAVGPDDESHAETPTAARPAAARSRKRVDIFALAAIGMPGTLPSGSHQDLAVRVGVGQLF